MTPLMTASLLVCNTTQQLRVPMFVRSWGSILVLVGKLGVRDCWAAPPAETGLQLGQPSTQQGPPAANSQLV